MDLLGYGLTDAEELDVDKVCQCTSVSLHASLGRKVVQCLIGTEISKAGDAFYST